MEILRMGKFLLWLLPKDIIAITLYPFAMYFKGDYIDLFPFTIHHEHIHWQQQKEMLCIFFYLWYGIEWLFKLIKWGRQSYYHISFEQEAYLNQDNPDYCTTRKHFAWLKYVL